MEEVKSSVQNNKITFVYLSFLFRFSFLTKIYAQIFPKQKNIVMKHTPTAWWDLQKSLCGVWQTCVLLVVRFQIFCSRKYESELWLPSKVVPTLSFKKNARASGSSPSNQSPPLPVSDLSGAQLPQCIVCIFCLHVYGHCHLNSNASL